MNIKQMDHQVKQWKKDNNKIVQHIIKNVKDIVAEEMIYPYGVYHKFVTKTGCNEISVYNLSVWDVNKDMNVSRLENRLYVVYENLPNFVAIEVKQREDVQYGMVLKIVLRAEGWE